MTGPISIPPAPPTPALTRFSHIVVYVAFFILALGSAPLWIPLSILANLVRPRSFIVLRVLCYGTFYLTLGTFCLLVIALINLRRLGNEPGLRYDYTRFRLWWGEKLLFAGMFFLNISIETKGEEIIAPGPLLVFLNHASLVDPVIPMYFISKKHGVDLRWIIKKELLKEPLFDIVGLKLGDCFVERASEHPEEQIRRVAERGINLDQMGVLVYPEGTRYTPQKRERAMLRLQNKPELLAIAERYRHVLPPHTGGPLALMDKAPNADLLFCAHVGLEGVATLVDLLLGEILGTSVKVFFWRVSARDIPVTNRERWLFEQWARVDEYIEQNQASTRAGHAEN